MHTHTLTLTHINTHKHTHTHTYAQVSERDEGEEGSSDSGESEEDEEAPLISLKTKRPNPFVKMLQGIWPFGESFKELGPVGKVYEIIKVNGRVLYFMISIVLVCAWYVSTEQHTIGSLLIDEVHHLSDIKVYTVLHNYTE